MNKIQGVSFPRSGHHMLMDLLQMYFSCLGNVNYCKYTTTEYNQYLAKRLNENLKLINVPKSSLQNDKPSSNIPTFTYCDSYSACNCSPCKDENTTFQKSHDFQLDIKIDSSMLYLVQIRAPIPAIISWFKLLVRDKHIEDTKESFENFFLKKQSFYNQFYTKWVKSKHDNIYVLDYDTFLDNPQYEFEKLLKFIFPTTTYNKKFLEEYWSSIVPKNNYKEFKYYSEDLLQTI